MVKSTCNTSASEVLDVPDPQPAYGVTTLSITTVSKHFRHQYLLWIVPALISMAVYANTLCNDFAYDDYRVLAAAKRVSLREALDTLVGLRGLCFVSFYADCHLWGAWSPGYHVTQIVLYAICVGLAAILAKHLSGCSMVGFVTGLLFAVHPVHVEAVASIANRKDILAMIAVTIASLFYIAGGRVRIALAYITICIGIVSIKDVAVVGLLFMLPLLDRVVLKRPFRGGPLWVIAAVCAVLLHDKIGELFSDQWVHNTTEHQSYTYTQVLARVATALPEQFRLLLWPRYLSADYPLSAPDTVRMLLGIGLLLGSVGLALHWRRTQPTRSVGVLWALLMYVPVSNVVPLIHFFVADRYLFVPSFGVCLCVGHVITFLIVGYNQKLLLRFTGAFVLALAVSLGSVRSFLRNLDWRSNDSLWSSEPIDRGFSPRYCTNRGAQLMSDARYSEAAEMFRYSLQHVPSHVPTMILFARCLEMTNRGTEAIELLRKCAQEFPNKYEVHMEFGGMLRRAGRAQDGVAAYRRALALRRTGDAMIELAASIVESPLDGVRDIEERREAIALATEALSTPGCNDALALLALASARAAVGEHKEATEAARGAITSAQRRGDANIFRYARSLLSAEEAALAKLKASTSIHDTPVK